eukprot:7739293-Alexandrium_andersonii.AAC.1
MEGGIMVARASWANCPTPRSPHAALALEPKTSDMWLNTLCVHTCMRAGRARGVRVHLLRQGERHAAK